MKIPKMKTNILILKSGFISLSELKHYDLRMKRETPGMNTKTKTRCLNLFHPTPREMAVEESEC